MADADHPTTPAARIDVTLDLCPMTFIKTRLRLETMRPGECLEVLVRDGEPLGNVGRSCEEEGHRVVERVDRGDGTWRLLIRRGADQSSPGS